MPDTVVKFVGKASVMQEINLKETSLAAPTASYSNCQSILTGQVLHVDSKTQSWFHLLTYSEWCIQIKKKNCV